MHPNDEPTRVAVRVPVPPGTTWGDSHVAIARREADTVLERAGAISHTVDLVHDDDGHALILTGLVR